MAVRPHVLNKADPMGLPSSGVIMRKTSPRTADSDPQCEVETPSILVPIRLGNNAKREKHVNRISKSTDSEVAVMLHMVVHILRFTFLSNDLHWDPNW